MTSEAKITQLELIALASGIWADMSNVSYLETIKNSSRLRPYFLRLQDHKVIEIGPGNKPVNTLYSCKDYIGAPGYPNDGLSVLRKVPTGSAVVVSFGVIDDSILGGNLPRQKGELAKRYIEELVQEINRVANPFSIVVGLDAEKYMGAPDISVAGRGGVYFLK